MKSDTGVSSTCEGGDIQDSKSELVWWIYRRLIELTDGSTWPDDLTPRSTGNAFDWRNTERFTRPSDWVKTSQI
jgi:hypothetical protein